MELQLLILLISCSLSLCYVTEEEKNLFLPTEYHFKAEQIILTSNFIIPIEVWYSGEQNKSRTDYYGGMVKRFYEIDPEDPEATIYQIFPMSIDTVTNELVCQQMESEEFKNYLLLDKSFDYEGEQQFDDRTVQVWKYVDVDENNKKETILYVYREGDLDIPVRQETIKYQTWTNGILSHSIINFYSFKTTLNSSDLDHTTIEECEDRGKLGKNLKADLEFLHPGIPDDVDTAFHNFKKHHNKKHSKHEHARRKEIFENNWRRVVEHNKKNLGYKLELNKFADLTDEELVHLTGTRPSDPEELGSVPFPFSEVELKAIEEELPLNYDMRLDGYITNVKNQGNCGSCWAFSSTAGVEGAFARRNGGRNIHFSEQSLVDCAWSENNGCDGGLVLGALKYIEAHGIPSEQEYGPYLQQDGYCNSENMTEVYKIKGFARVPPLSVIAMKTVLYKYGPVIVSIYAGEHMKLYSNGIFYDTDCEKDVVNHGVTVVGYGVRDGVTYWIVKNSWGEDWGEDGYILMSSINNNCNLMSNAYYPIV